MTTFVRNLSKVCRQMVLNLSLTLGHPLIICRDLLDVPVSFYGLQPFHLPPNHADSDAFTSRALSQLNRCSPSQATKARPTVSDPRRT
jgi:hypothetical protein